jgi:hypothetical protein
MRNIVALTAFGMWVLITTGLFIAGCRESTNKISTAGSVTYNGEPLNNGAIAFYPVTGRPTIVSLSADGHYTVDLDPGHYVVTVQSSTKLPEGFKEGDPVPPPKHVLPPEYSVRARSKLSATIKANQTEPVDFTLE